ncbi:acetyltransferase [Roseomonas sp. SSH11]|uniref:Acetyltransferase n=1 Tax=Pararoseomonas baculiformis TaxID=2820812 RepID=A0ABS4ADP6_9PROT|nr:acetyltransferase [Pararoseomonas baculiformis]MBP0444638.1 acetyltransferase [Pararoseomonas baculiformis]
MARIRRSSESDLPFLLAIWRGAVRATHGFLSPADFFRIERLVAEDYLPRGGFWVAADDGNRPLGFMGMTGAHVDALFVDPAFHGQGIGRLLLGQALEEAGPVTVDVNEQNGEALGFYRRMGFRPFGRSETDGEGRPYPLLHLWMDGPAHQG